MAVKTLHKYRQAGRKPSIKYVGKLSFKPQFFHVRQRFELSLKANIFITRFQGKTCFGIRMYCNKTEKKEQ